MNVYVVQETETKEIVLCTTNKGKAMSFLDEDGYSVSGYTLED